MLVMVAEPVCFWPTYLQISIVDVYVCMTSRIASVLEQAYG